MAKRKSQKPKSFTVEKLEAVEEAMKEITAKEGKFNLWRVSQEVKPEPNWDTLKNIAAYLVEKKRLKIVDEDAGEYAYAG